MSDRPDAIGLRGVAFCGAVARILADINPSHDNSVLARALASAVEAYGRVLLGLDAVAVLYADACNAITHETSYLGNGWVPRADAIERAYPSGSPVLFAALYAAEAAFEYASQWGNTIRDDTIHRFLDAASVAISKKHLTVERTNEVWVDIHKEAERYGVHKRFFFDKD